MHNPDLYIVTATPHALRGAGLTVEEADLATDVVYGPATWDEAQEYWRKRMGDNNVLLSPGQDRRYAYYSVRGITDPRWATVLAQATVCAARKTPAEVERGCSGWRAIERAERRACKAFNDHVGATYLGGGWWDYEGTGQNMGGPVQGYATLLSILTRRGIVQRGHDPATGAIAYVFYPALTGSRVVKAAA